MVCKEPQAKNVLLFVPQFAGIPLALFSFLTVYSSSMEILTFSIKEGHLEFMLIRLTKRGVIYF